MRASSSKTTLVEGRRARHPIQVSRELLELYQPALGPIATILWLNIRWLAELDLGGDLMETLQFYTGLTKEQIDAGLRALVAAGLLDILDDGTHVINDPLSEAEFLRVFPEGLAAAKDEPIDEPLPAKNDDLQAVLSIYHKKVGLLGPVQYEKLRAWVEEKGMGADVVALAIHEMARSAPTPRIQYLEGILRNWYNDGVRTMADMIKRKKSTRAAGEGKAAGESYEGCPNAGAYKAVQPNLVERWKELYPDECGS
ncbi:MAG: DnaD domain-containing protein [Limnochordia bacterium]|jgi:DnaD/phage-associated family protein